MPSAACLDKLDEIAGQRLRLGAKGRHVHSLPDIQRGIERYHAENRRGAAQILPDIAGGVVLRGELERVAMAEPAAQRLPEPAMMSRRDIEKGWRAWAAIQIFVTAADGEIRLAPS